MNKEYTTYTGIPFEEIPQRLSKPFEDPRAYRGIPGAADLTDINTGHMLDRVTQVFGMKGVGWNLLFSPDNMEILFKDGELRVTARLRYAEFVINLIDGEGEIFSARIPTSGANTNELGFAEEGARTSALGSALKGLCFQLPVYKGELDHHNAAIYGSSPAPEPPAMPLPKRDPIPRGPKSRPVAVVQQPVLMAAESNELSNYTVDVGTKHNGRKLSELSEPELAWYASIDGKGMEPSSEKARVLQVKAQQFLNQKQARSV